MSKITAEHLSRRACVYIRQSTPDQVHNNLESQRRQYALVERARQLGWASYTSRSSLLAWRRLMTRVAPKKLQALGRWHR